MKTLLHGICLGALLFMNSSCLDRETSSGEEEKGAIQHVDAGGAFELITESPERPVILDIRTPEEFEEGHIEGAVNIDYKSADFGKQLQELDRGDNYIVHCRSGRRSTASLEVFEGLGFESVYHLDGGILAWQEAGKPVVKGDDRGPGVDTPR